VAYAVLDEIEIIGLKWP